MGVLFCPTDFPPVGGGALDAPPAARRVTIPMPDPVQEGLINCSSAARPQLQAKQRILRRAFGLLRMTVKTQKASGFLCRPEQP